MKLSILKTTALAALAVAILPAPSARAAISISTDDLMIGFRVAGYTTKDYLIDIGPAASFVTATTPQTFSLGTAFANDLNTAFAASGGTILWGLVATSGAATVGNDPANTIYVSEPTGGTIPTEQFDQSGPQSKISAIRTLYRTASGNVTNGTVTIGGVVKSAFSNTTPQGSWYNQAAAVLTDTNNISPLEAPLTTSLDLFRSPPSSTPGSQSGLANLGTFSFSGNTLTFTPTTASAVPEPSTVLFGCLTLGAIGIRRRRAILA